MGIDLVGVDLVEVRHTLIAMLWRRPILHSVLAMKRNKRRRKTSSLNISQLEGIAPKVCQMTTVKYQQFQKFANVVKKEAAFGFGTLATQL